MGYSKVYWEYGSAGKASSVSVRSVALTVGNIVAQEAARAAFEAAVDAVSLGSPGSETFTATESEVAKNPAGDTGAQREIKWLVSYTDDVNGFGGNFTIPCADDSLLGSDGVFMDTANTEYTDLRDAVEAFVRSKAGNAVTMTSVKYSARTLG